ncbi:hypothetical protein AVEN_16534-1 [Araneus ventricosus]|uniref:Cadherin domain-containing protein n=1 Tax=Araneus ventricosus TaxID=182803 RepID=A0A4Y2N7W9_ARAVE|nr:hypothetical protein AVEN_16534-1 [Araneus ventricosus]
MSENRKLQRYEPALAFPWSWAEGGSSPSGQALTVFNGSTSLACVGKFATPELQVAPDSTGNAVRVLLVTNKSSSAFNNAQLALRTKLHVIPRRRSHSKDVPCRILSPCIYTVPDRVWRHMEISGGIRIFASNRDFEKIIVFSRSFDLWSRVQGWSLPAFHTYHLTKYIRIGIGDKNDNPPYFEQASYEAEVNEDEDIQHTVITVTAKDKDECESSPSLLFSLCRWIRIVRKYSGIPL